VNSQGRGGISAAGKKFGVSYIALRRWMNGETGGRKAGRAASKGMDGRKMKTVRAAVAALKSFKKQITRASEGPQATGTLSSQPQRPARKVSSRQRGGVMDALAGSTYSR